MEETTETQSNESDNALEQLKTLVETQHNQVQNMIEAKFNAIAELFADKLAYDLHKQQQIDQLHEELQLYKADLIAKTNRPLINGIIKLYQDISKTLDNLKSKPEDKLTSELYLNRIDDIGDDVDVLLSQHGVSRFNEPGEALNPRRQRALKNIETNDENKHGQVCERVRPGFEYANELLQKELVNLFIYKASKSTESVNEPEEPSIDQTEIAPELPICDETSEQNIDEMNAETLTESDTNSEQDINTIKASEG